MVFKRGLVLSLLCAAVGAQASYELLLVADFSNGRVHRYDGDSGAYMGSFGGAPPKASGIHATSDGLCYVGTYGITGGIGVYNYNTGAYINSFLLPGSSNPRSIMPCTAPGYAGQVLINYTSTSHVRGIISPTGFTPLATYTSTGIGSSARQASNGRILSFISTGSVRVFEPNGSIVSTSAVLPGFLAADELASIDLVGSNIFATFTNNFVPKIIKGTFNGSSISWVGAVPFSVPAAYLYNFGSAPGHGARLFYSMGDSTLTSSKIYKYDTVFNSQVEIPIGGMTAGFGMTTIITPEPSTWIAAAAGLAMLVRRRRMG